MPETSLKQKSLENIASADLLVQKGYFDSSVHCSYYGCLQLVKLVLNKVGNIDFERQHLESRSAKEGSHLYYLNTFSSLFRNGQYKNEIHVHINDIKKLKQLRVSADYDPEKVDSCDCSSAVSTAKLFSDYVINKFKI